MKKYMRFEKEMNALGWHIEHTGGNCLAYIKYVPGRPGIYWLLTLSNDAYIPENMGDNIAVSLLNENVVPYHNESITEVFCKFGDVIIKKIKFDKE